MSMHALQTIIKIKSRGKTVIAIATFPFDKKTIRQFSFDRLIYDCMDYPGDMTNVENDKRIKKQHHQLLLTADVTCVTSRVAGAFCAKAKKCVIIPTGFILDDIIKTHPSKPLLDHIPRPIIGFLGFTFVKLDLTLLTRVAEENPNMSFVLVGPADGAKVWSNTPPRIARLFNTRWKKLSALPNVYHIDYVKRTDVRRVLHEFDVGITPYDVTQKPVTYGNPIKTYEYLAAGKPVVSTPIKTILNLSQYVYFAKDSDEFSEMIQKALRARSVDVRKRRTFAKQNDLNGKTDALLAIFRSFEKK